MTGINICAVALVAFLYFYLNIQFAGFPYRSPQKKQSLTTISKVLALWTVSRIAWAIALLVVFVCGIELLHNSKSPKLSAILLFFLFLVCEILPIAVMLDYSYVQIMDFEDDNVSNHHPIGALVEQDYSLDSAAAENDEWLGGMHDSFGLGVGASSESSDDEEPLLMQV
eukprot:CAMPEP_0197257282 /NCGR_PEP_ID=MMETSP1429-20130617/78179_1 /TAXON_ID=49237 /ORGANISM="Chaetoceros  sp., Strain UNC1202" /LENGTH=168 /DNA_ID=CAMNT_0042721077 /DNA_START=219 /DNA_END=725 /DNA_ORIENTATION=-